MRDVTTDLDLRNPQMNIEIDREKAAVYGISIDQVRQELFNAFGSRQVATIYTPDDDYQVILESKPEFQTNISALSRIYPEDRERTVGAAGSGDAAHDLGRAAAGQPPGQPARGHDLVQSRARRLARAGGRCHPADRARGAAAGHRRVELPGLGAGVPGFAQRAGHPGAGGDLRRLCAARHPLRELHPSDHDHLRPAVGRHRRAAHADGVQDGPVGHRHDRHRDAGRHRQEERDHDDRLRDRAAKGRARTRRRRSAKLRCCASGRS